jgi:hypothetical protein
MNPPRPDPSFRRAALDHQEWLDIHWQKAHQPSPFEAPETDLTPHSPEAASKLSRELNACEMALVILGGVLMFVGFLMPVAVLPGIFCFILALAFSAYRKA